MTAPAIMKGAGQCPRCASRKVTRVDAEMEGVKFYGRVVEVCVNCQAIWEPFDPAQLLDADAPRTSCFREPCDNCAFRPGSHEQQNVEEWKKTMASLKAGGSFYCHKGVPINPRSENGFDYPLGPDGKALQRKMRLCRGFLRMWGRMYGLKEERDAETV